MIRALVLALLLSACAPTFPVRQSCAPIGLGCPEKSEGLRLEGEAEPDYEGLRESILQSVIMTFVLIMVGSR